MNYLTYDTHSIDKSLERPSPLRPYATRTPQIPSFDTTSDVSLQTIPSASNVLVKTHKIGNPSPNLDPPLPPALKNPITTQRSSSHSPYQYITPSEPSPSNTSTTQPTPSQIQQPRPPFPLYFHNVTATQLKALFFETYIQTTLSTIPHHPTSFSISQNPSSSSNDPYASLKYNTRDESQHKVLGISDTK